MIENKHLDPSISGVFDYMEQRAEMYAANGQLEQAAALLAQISAAKPDDTNLMLKVAVFQAWVGQEQEFASTIDRALSFAKGTIDRTIAQRTARACCLLPSDDRSRFSAALDLARAAPDLGGSGTSPGLAQLTLGMAEYRNGNFSEADEALQAAATDNKNIRFTVTADFYRAMSLFHQDKRSEARELALAAAARMRLLPADMDKPLADGAVLSDMIAWLAYQEAESLLQFSDVERAVSAD